MAARPLPIVITAAAFAALHPAGETAAQNFVAVTDSTNPIVTETVSGNYLGCAWVDVDDDGLLDLFLARKGAIYHNLGGGAFEKLTNVIANQGNATLGTTWADYDNDGDIDCYLAGGPAVPDKGSMLYRNDGGITFSRVTTGAIGDALTNASWGAAWGDVDNDGWVDVVTAAANGFAGINHPNVLLHNEGDGTFTYIDSTAVTAALDAYTIPAFADYDLDGDVDLFIGSGEIAQLDPDNLYLNELIETGSVGFPKITTAPIATDSLDGQVWNWIDYDNDGDLDAFQTNYRATLANNLYRNDAGTYVKMTAGDVGTIVADPANSLGNTWADFDNDGDLDCFVTNDGGALADYYVNDGDGTFTQNFATPIAKSGPHWGASAGDYDNDGDLDLYVHGATLTHALFRNDLAGGNAWVNLKLVGAGAPGGSNVSALGARVRAKATIGGVPVWQMREVSAQNAFNAMNMLNVHFGFGNAAVIDSLEIRWPAGGVQVFEDVPVNRFYRFVEGADPTAAGVGVRHGMLRLLPGSPNPFGVRTQLGFETPRPVSARLEVYDVAGRLVRILLDGPVGAGRHVATWDGRDDDGHSVAAGVYLVRLLGPDGAALAPSGKAVLIR
jgi:hypothetical protein